MLHRPLVRRQARRRGTAVVEFVAVLPLYFLLILGIWEGGRMLYVLQICNNAAREGCRLAMRGDATVDPLTGHRMSSAENVRDTILNYIQNADPTINPASVIIEVKKVNPAGTGSEIPGGGDIDASDRTLPVTNPLRVMQLDHLRVRVTIPYSSVQLVSGVPRLIGVDNLVGVCDGRCMLDQPFTLDPSVPSW